MELEKGFKKTDVGLIPTDWITIQLSEISTPVRGGSPRPAGDPKYFNGNYIPWLTVAALTSIPESQVYVSRTESFLTKEGSLYSRILEKETLIISNSGATLGVAKLLDIRCCANDGIAALLDVKGEINKLFVVYYLNTLTKYLRESVATGNGQPNLNTNLIGNLPIPLPPTKTEQTAIATALSDTDALITSLEKLIAKKRNIKQGAMQKLLRYNKDWPKKKLGEIANSISSGKSLTNSKRGKYPIYGSTGIIGWSDSNDYEGNRILVARVGANAGFVQKVSGRYSVSDNTLVLSIKPNVSIDFVFLKLIYYRLNTLVFGSGQPLITGGQLKVLDFSIPSFEEQERIASILSDMNEEIIALENKLKKCLLVKSGMMQTLLTGKIRLV